MTPAARTFKGSFLFCPRGQIPRARRGQTHAPFPGLSVGDTLIAEGVGLVREGMSITPKDETK